MSKALKVNELIKRLQRMDPEALVYEARAGEVRALGASDITSTHYDDDEEADADGEVISGPVVVFGAWG